MILYQFIHNSHLFFISHSWFGKTYVPPFVDSFGLVEQHFVSFLYYSFKLGTAEIRAHYSHPFPLRPIQLAILLIEIDLFWCECGAPGNDHLAIPPIEVGALDGTIVQIGNSYICPVNSLLIIYLSKRHSVLLFLVKVNTFNTVLKIIKNSQVDL